MNYQKYDKSQTVMTDQQQFCGGFNWPTFSFAAVNDSGCK
jgi:hypothetical protein